MRTKCIIGLFGEELKIRVKRFKQNLPENCLKSIKIAIIACKFSRVACPQTPLKPFLLLNQLQISSAEKKVFENNVEIMPPPPLKILAMLVSAVYQHFPNEGSKFCSKVAVGLNNSQDWDSIIPLHFHSRFANYYWYLYKNTC